MSDQLQVVLEMRQKAEDQAARQVADLERQRDQLQGQLQALEDYARDYQLQLSRPGQMAMHQRQVIQAYLQQVQEAMVGMQDKIRLAERGIDQARQRWLDAHQKKQGIHKLVEQRQQQAQRQLEQQEQKQSDALSQLRFGQGRSD